MVASDDNESRGPRLPNGHSASRRHLFKILFKARLIDDAAKYGKELREPQRVDWVAGDWLSLPKTPSGPKSLNLAA